MEVAIELFWILKTFQNTFLMQVPLKNDTQPHYILWVVIIIAVLEESRQFNIFK